MDCWRHVLLCSSAQTHVIEVGWSIERFGGQAIWQTCSLCGTSFWSRCAQNVPACSVHIYIFQIAVRMHGFQGKIGCLSSCELVDASCAVPGMRARDGEGLPCNCCRLVCSVPTLGRRCNVHILPCGKSFITVCHLKLESSSTPRVKG